jgi:hypothetical protein
LVDQPSPLRQFQIAVASADYVEILMPSFLRRLRQGQIRTTARLLFFAEKLLGGSRLVRGLANWPAAAPFLNASLGYLRVFDNLQEAEAAYRPYAPKGFYHPDYAKHYLKISEFPRPSDYTALFHMRGLDFEGAKIFDVGGTVGNLFYLYDRYAPAQKLHLAGV